MFTSLPNVYYNILNHLEINHLWFIENLYYLSLLCIPIILFLRSGYSLNFRDSICSLFSKRFGTFVFILPVVILNIISKKYFPEDDKAIENLYSTLFYGYFFLMGMLLASENKIWIYLKKYRKSNAIITVIAIVAFYIYYLLPDGIASSYWSIPTRWTIWYGVSSLVSGTVIITLLGYGQFWFAAPSKTLSVLNRGIYPFYIVHQTVIVIIGYYIIQQAWSIPFKLITLFLVSLSLCILIYKFLILPFRPIGFLFGMKNKMNKSSINQ